jgi:transcriptional regulator with XRE-family HTH domain
VYEIANMTLDEWLQAKKINVVAFADELGLDHSTLYRAISGERMPSLEVAFAIEHLTRGKVKAETFLRMTPEEYIEQWRGEARKSINPDRRARANALWRRDRDAVKARESEAA